ncbi:amidohydrolase family protein [Herbiconiux moechotypicola]|uniref:Amidohydrolase family protein n=1 Tax=Herbiconiux moechotypicola TaxID=637393 RepID=A0ABN3DCX5_9MICO|nr:amidohydrolase family protein [Herbiconiux moechotypicola]MCS5728712.1 amidohydrolase family protein [Herbiconiux moechotypicola]
MTESKDILITGGTVLTGVATDPAQPGADVLILDGRIAAIGPDLAATGIVPAGTEVIDAAGSVVMPGFVDTHRHTWQAIVRNIASDWSLDEYMAGLHVGLSRHFRPEDTYVSNYLGALEALDSGITTLVDWSHNLRTTEHADAAVKALEDTGMRAVFAHGGGAAQWGGEMPSPVEHPRDDATRLRTEHFASNDGLVTMALALRGPQFTTREVNRADFALARDLDLRVTVHVGDGHWGKMRPIIMLQEDGLLSDTITYVHCTTLSDEELRIIAATGGSASVAPDVEAQMGHGYPATGRLLAAGVRPSFSIDVCSSNGGDMFGTMRTAIGLQRAADNKELVDAGVIIERIGLGCADVIQFATLDGANAAGLGGQTGSLEVGKKADVIVVSGNSLAMSPLNNPFGGIVYNAHPGLVTDVIVDGVVRKRDGRLVGVDVKKLRDEAAEARDYILSQMPAASVDGAWHPEVAHA